MRLTSALLLAILLLAPAALAAARTESRDYVWVPPGASERGNTAGVRTDTLCAGVSGACFEVQPGDAGVQVVIREAPNDSTRGGFAQFATAEGRGVTPWVKLCGATDLAVPEGAERLYVSVAWVPECRGLFYSYPGSAVSTVGTITATFT